MRWKKTKLALLGLTCLAAPAMLGATGASAQDAKKAQHRHHLGR
jgi:hypothetical protein